jgi:hypothetical protein
MELSDRYKIDEEGKLDVELVRISDYYFLTTQEKLDLLDLLQNWINERRYEM